MLKEVATLREAGYFDSIEIAGILGKGVSERDRVDGIPVWRVPIASRGLPKDLVSQSLKLVEWGARVVSAHRHRNLGVIHCHDLEPLPVALTLKHLTGAKVIYDAHELETERQGHGAVRRTVLNVAERSLVRGVDEMITVSPSIRDWYARRYPEIPVALVRNIPHRPADRAQPEPLRERLGVPAGALLFLYLGGLGTGRGIERMVQAFMPLAVPHHLLVMGSGPLKPVVDAARTACPRIHWLPPVAPGKVLEFAAGADVGVCLYEDTCLNHRYCMPNKLFEYLVAGVPVLVSPLPDMSDLVRRFEAGWIVNDDPFAIAGILGMLTREEWSRLNEGLADRTRCLGWHSEAAALLAVYERTLLVN